MSLATLITLGLQTSVALTVFVLGLSASPSDATYLFRRPGQLVKSLLSMYVVMPLFAAAMISAFEMHPAVKIALITLAVSPIPPMLPQKVLKAGGGAYYMIGLLVAAAVFAILFVPLAVDLLGRAFGKPAHESLAVVAAVVAGTVLAPLAAGLVVRREAPGFADRIAKPVSLVASVLLVACVLPMLFKAMPAMASLIGDGTLVAIVAFVLVGIASGHLLGGPERDDRTTLALTTASRHPGVAMAIASANFPQQKLATAAILLYLLVNGIVSIPYVIWRKHRHRNIANAAYHE